MPLSSYVYFMLLLSILIFLSISNYNRIHSEWLKWVDINYKYILGHPISYTKFNLKLPDQNMPPTFIHIPKTGGTTISMKLLEYNIRVGIAAFYTTFQGHGNIIDKYNRKYQIVATHPEYGYDSFNCSRIKNYKYFVDCKQCSLWHSPPHRYVPNSFVIVRDPLSRLLR